MVSPNLDQKLPNTLIFSIEFYLIVLGYIPLVIHVCIIFLILFEKFNNTAPNVRKNILRKRNKAIVEFRVGTAGGGNQARQPYLEKYNFRIDNNLDNTNHIHDFGLYIGNHPELNNEQIINLCGKLNDL